MDTKISAQKLMDVVSDTNKKVTELSKQQKAENPASMPTSKLASAIVAVLSIIGIALSVLIFFPGVWETLGVTLAASVWKIIYLVYAGVALFVSSVAHIGTPLRIWAVIMAIAPVSIQIIFDIV